MGADYKVMSGMTFPTAHKLDLKDRDAFIKSKMSMREFGGDYVFPLIRYLDEVSRESIRL